MILKRAFLAYLLRGKIHLKIRHCSLQQKYPAKEISDVSTILFGIEKGQTQQYCGQEFKFSDFVSKISFFVLLFGESRIKVCVNKMLLI